MTSNEDQLAYMRTRTAFRRERPGAPDFERAGPWLPSYKARPIMAEYEIQLITIAPSEPKIRNKASAFRLTCSVPRSGIVTLQSVISAAGTPNVLDYTWRITLGKRLWNYKLS